MQLVLEHWIRSQRSYFVHAARRNDRRNRLILYLGFAFLAATVGASLLTLFLGSGHPLLAASALVPAMWAFVQFYAEKRAFAPLAKQYARMSYAFAVAEHELSKTLQAGDSARAQQLLRELISAPVHIALRAGEVIIDPRARGAAKIICDGKNFVSRFALAK